MQKEAQERERERERERGKKAGEGKEGRLIGKKVRGGNIMKEEMDIK